MRSALARMRFAFHAALIPIGTTSSWLPSVGTDWTLAGVARTRQSATRAAAAICTVMNPDSSPGSRARKAGSPDDRSGFTTRSMRRSANPASVVMAIPITSRERDRLAMEVAAREHIVTEDERIVGRCIQLSRHEALGKRERFSDRAEDLWTATQRVCVLYSGVVLAMRFPNLAVGQQLAQQFGGALLPLMRPGVVDARDRKSTRLNSSHERLSRM